MENLVDFGALVSMIVLVVLIRFSRWARYKLNFTTSSSLLLAAFVVLTFILGGQLGWVNNPEESGWCERFAKASIYGIQTVADILEGNAEEFRKGYPNHHIATWCLSFGIPLLTVSTALSFVVNFLPRPLLHRKEYLIFSQVEENGMLLAENMMSEGWKWYGPRKVIFLRTDEEKLSPEYADRIKGIHAKVYPYSEADFLRIHWPVRRRKLRFFFLTSDTDLNFSRMKSLVEAVRQESLFAESWFTKADCIKEEEKNGVFRQELYLLSETESAPLLIDHLREQLCYERKDKKDSYVRRPVFEHTDLRLLDRYRTVTYSLLQKKPLYDTADDKENRVLILGFGKVGQAFFRTAVSFCEMAGYKTSFCIVDREIGRQWKEMLLTYPPVCGGCAG